MSLNDSLLAAAPTPRTHHWIPRSILAALSLVLAFLVVNARRPHLASVLAEQHLGVEPGFEGLAISTAVAILWMSIAVVIFLAHGLARFVDTRWIGGGDSLTRRPATIGVHLAVLALLTAAAFASEDMRALAAVLPDIGLLAVLVVAAGLGWWARRDAGRDTRLIAAATASGFVLLTALGAGRWF